MTTLSDTVTVAMADAVTSATAKCPFRPHQQLWKLEVVVRLKTERPICCDRQPPVSRRRRTTWRKPRASGATGTIARISGRF